MKRIAEILGSKPEARPRTHHGLLKIGQTTRDAKQRVAEQAGEPKGGKP